jgi:hypothetical protein
MTDLTAAMYHLPCEEQKAAIQPIISAAGTIVEASFQIALPSKTKPLSN